MSAPWLDHSVVDLCSAMAASHLRVLGRPLLDGAACNGSAQGHIRDADVALSHALYFADVPLLCHDGASDPLFVYANVRAQRLWRMAWDEFIGLPSRLSAPPAAREDRATSLGGVRTRGFTEGYSGVRVAADGELFTIEDVCIWNVLDAGGRPIGQAARIGRWSWHSADVGDGCSG